MAVATGSNLSKYFGADQIFSGVGFQLTRGDKVALVGVNGAGKSTLIRMIAGLDEPTTGTIGMARGARVSYLAQEAQFSGTRTLLQEAQTAFAHVHAMEKELRALEPLLADTEHAAWEARMDRYGDLQARFEHAGGYDLERTIEQTLEGLSFAKAQWHQPVGEFSGGQKTRAALAIALLEDPDLLLLDEPTNHLDLHALQWLEEFLRTWPGTLIVISHDRYFLDRVTTRTWEMAWGKLHDWPGNYSTYVQLKAERDERMTKEYEGQQAFIAKEEEFIRRHMAGQRTKEAQGRLKRLTRFKRGWTNVRGIEIKALDGPPPPQKHMALNLQSARRTGDFVLTLSDGYTVGYQTPSGPKPLVRTPRLELMREDCVALMGANGSGKTTLLRTIVGELEALHGRATLGAGVTAGYYAQTHDELILDNTVLDEVHRVKPLVRTEEIRTLLGRFLFSEDDVFKRVGDLSGGERARVALAQLTLRAPNVLILDEPTNHLDIAAREALENVLAEFNGTILFVSHDRYFIDALADTIWMVEDGTVKRFEGNYSAYAAHVTQREAERKKIVEPRADLNNDPPKPRDRNGAGVPSAREQRDRERQQRDQQKRINALERQIAQLEQQLKDTQAALEAATAARKIDQIAALGNEYVALEQRLLDEYERWAEMAQ